MDNDASRKLRKDLKQAREHIDELNNLLRQRETHFIDIDTDRNRYRNEINHARKALMQYQEVLDIKVAEAVNAEQQRFQAKLKDIEGLQEKNIQQEAQIKNLTDIINLKSELLSKCHKQLSELGQKYDIKEITQFIKELEEYRNERQINIEQIQQMNKLYNELSSQMETILAENKLLRKMAKVADNFGFDLEQIKFAEKQKVEDYKSQVRYLEKEIEELEGERMLLRYKLRDISSLYSKEPGQRYQGLTQEQLFIVDDIVRQLKDNNYEIPLNDRSKEYLKEIERLKGQIEILSKNQNQNFENYIQNKNINSNSEKVDYQQIDLIKQGQDEMKIFLQELLQNPTLIQSQSGKKNNQQVLAPQLNPGPFGNWNDIRDGHSKRLESQIQVDFQDSNYKTDFDAQTAKYEIANLQLQLIECLKLHDIKDQRFESQQEDSLQIKNELEQCLLAQDELFRRYQDNLNEYEAKKQKFDAQEQLYEETIFDQKRKLDEYEKSIQAIQSSDRQEVEKQLAEYTKRVAIIDSNLIKLSRKYNILQDENSQLKDSYQKIEQNYVFNEEQLLKQVYELQKYKKIANKQLNILLDHTKESIPKEEYNRVISNLDILNQKYCSLMIQFSEKTKQISQQESLDREHTQLKEQYQELEDEINEISFESDIIKLRLEIMDPLFSQHQRIVKRMVEIIKESDISPQYIFKKFDKDADGTIDRQEMLDALNTMKIILTKEEETIFFQFIDLDGKDQLHYIEFLRVLRRNGLKTISDDEKIIQKIYNIIKENNITLQEAFKAFDKDSSNSVSENEMIVMLTELCQNIQREQISRIFYLADINGDGKINFEEFYSLFKQQIKESETHNFGLQNRELNRLQKIVLDIDEGITKNNMNIQQLFDIIDIDKSGFIDITEFDQLLKNLGIHYNFQDVESMYREIDTSNSKRISFQQLVEYFKSCKKQASRLERIKLMIERNENIKKESQKNDTIQDNLKQISENNRLEMKVSMLEVRERNAKQKKDQIIQQMVIQEEFLDKQEKQIDQLQMSFIKQQEEYYKVKEKYSELQTYSEGGLSRDASLLLEAKYDKIKMENAELRTVVSNYKYLYEASLNQTKQLMLSIDKQKNEAQIYKEALSDLQCQNDEKAMIGKQVYQLMISQWNEAEVNKKNEQLSQTINYLQEEMLNLENQIQEQNEENTTLHIAYSQRIQNSTQECEDLRMKIIPAITPEKIENLELIIQQLAFKKSNIEKTNKELRDQNNEYFLNQGYYEAQKKILYETEQRLKKNNQDDISLQIMEISHKLKESKLNELKLKRSIQQVEEKEEYIQRINKQLTQQVCELEQQLANWEVKYTSREQFWMKKTKELNSIIVDKQIIKKDQQNNILKLKDQKQVVNDKLNQSKVLQNKNEVSEELKQQISELQDQLEEKDIEFNKLKEIVNTSQVSQNAEFKNLKMQFAEDEAEKIQQAAQRTIMTLEQLIDDKNNQIKRLENNMKSQKEDFFHHKQKDLNEIQRLNELLYEQHLNINSQILMDKQNTSFSVQNKTKQTELLVPEMEMIIKEKDKIIEDFKKKGQQFDQIRQQKNQQIKDQEQQIEQLQSQIYMESNRSDIQQMTNDIEQFKKMIKTKNKDIDKLKKSLESLKDDYLKAMQNKNEPSNQSIDTQQAEQSLKTAQILIQDQKKQIKDLKNQNSELNKLKIKLENQLVDTKKELDNIQNQLKRKDMLQDTDKKSMSSLNQNKTIKSKIQPQEVSSLKIEVKKLQNDITNLNQENLKLKSVQSISMFDQQGYLTGFKDLPSLLSKINIHLTNNPSLQFCKISQKADTYNEGTLNDKQLFEKLEMCGIKLQSKHQQSIIDKFSIKGKIDYIKFYYAIMNKQLIEIQTSELKNNEKYLENKLKEWKESSSKYEMENQYLIGQNNQNNDLQKQQKKDNDLKILKMNEQIDSLNEKILSLENKLFTEKDYEIKKLNYQLQSMYEDVNNLTKENQKLQDIMKKDSKQQNINENEYIIQNLKEKIQDLINKEKSIIQQLFKLESQNMELQFFKDNQSPQLNRLQQRNQELEIQVKEMLMQENQMTKSILKQTVPRGSGKSLKFA